MVDVNESTATELSTGYGEMQFCEHRWIAASLSRFYTDEIKNP